MLLGVKFFEISRLPRGSRVLIDAAIESSGFNFISRFSILIYRSIHTRVPNTLSFAYIIFNRVMRWLHLINEKRGEFLNIVSRRLGKLIHSPSNFLHISRTYVFLVHQPFLTIHVRNASLPHSFASHVFPVFNRKVTCSTRISISKTIRMEPMNSLPSWWNNLVQSLSLSLSLSSKKSIKISIEADPVSNEYASETNSCKLGIVPYPGVWTCVRPPMSRNIDIYD